MSWKDKWDNSNLPPDVRRQLAGSKVNPLFTKRPYWCTNYGVLDDEMSEVRRRYKGSEDGESRVQHDSEDEEVYGV